MASKIKSAPVKSIDLPVAIINNFFSIKNDNEPKEIVNQMIVILKKNNIFMNLSKINKYGFNGYCSVCGRVTIRKGKLKKKERN
jgi:hypothetical protein